MKKIGRQLIAGTAGNCSNSLLLKFRIYL